MFFLVSVYFELRDSRLGKSLSSSRLKLLITVYFFAYAAYKSYGLAKRKESPNKLTIK